MPTPSTLGAQSQLAHQRALEVIEDHGDPERVERLRTIPVPMATTRNPHHLVAFQAEIIASLAELYDELDLRVGRLENAAQEATRAASTEGAKKK
jgi:hypothetical protein